MSVASVWDNPALADALGVRLEKDLRQMVLAYESSRDRSQQVDIGPSEIGKPCTRCLARHALGMRITGEFSDPWCAILGTAGHMWLEEAAEHQNKILNRARLLPDLRVHPDADLIPTGGCLDVYDQDTYTVVDHKIVSPARLKTYRLSGPGPQYRVQGHTYGLGLANEGKRVDNVAIAFWPRGGRLNDLYVWTESYKPQIARDALTRWRTIRDQARAIGPAILPNLPADLDCWDCGGKDVTPEELAAQPNPASPALPATA